MLMRMRGIPALAILALLSMSYRAEGQGFRIDGALFLVRPQLDGRSAEVFAALGKFRIAPGADVGIGYDMREYGLTMSVAFAGIDVGEPFSVNGIDMGRQAGIYRSAAMSAQWRAPYGLRRWRPVLSLGYVRSGLDNILLPGDSLPSFARSLGGPAPDTARRLVGVSGAGLRVGIGLRRDISASDFSGRMAMNVGATLDVVRFGRMSYDGMNMRVPGAGRSLVPRVHAALTWWPGAAPTHGAVGILSGGPARLPRSQSSP